MAIVDICTGLYATIGILAALESRRRSGKGQLCEIGLHDSGIATLANVASIYLATGTEPGRYGNGHPNIVPRRTYEASDGEIAIAVGNDRQLGILAEVLGHPEWVEDERFATNTARVENRQLVDDRVAEVVIRRDRAHWLALLQEARIPSGPINLVSEALGVPRQWRVG